MVARDPGEPQRAATPLELFFDLCFVVAVAQAASRLHHHLAEGHVLSSAHAYVLVFFAIWWAWMNFTWFASAYDADDVPYRLKVFVQMVGGLILAAGVPRAFDHGDFTIVTVGYCVMRVGLVAQWLRAARADPAHRRTALRYVLGLVACQAGWLALLCLPQGAWPLGWLVLAPAELAVPMIAERARKTSWHPHHIAERYGLFTLIVLGESVLASTGVIQSAIAEGELSLELAGLVVGAPLILFSMWWIYFHRPSHRILTSSRRAFEWGYGHLVIFASTAAVGAGLGVATDFARGRGHLSATAAGATVAVPVALYVLTVWALDVRPLERGRASLVAWPIAAALVLFAPLSGAPVLAIGITLCVLAAVAVGGTERPTQRRR
jgi:low temperature requirement protein LtrA